MIAVEIVKRIAGMSPRFKARIAGVLYFFSLLMGGMETVLHGVFNYAAGSIAILGMVAVTLLIYAIFRPVNRSFSLLAVLFAFVGLGLEALRWQPHGVNFAVVFHGFYCLLIGYIIFRSTFVPRVLGVLLTFAGLVWLTFLSHPLVYYLSPYNLACGLLVDVSLFLWLLVMGVNVSRWKEQASVRQSSDGSSGS
jgi:hypothetical protein